MASSLPEIVCGITLTCGFLLGFLCRADLECDHVPGQMLNLIGMVPYFIKMESLLSKCVGILLFNN